MAAPRAAATGVQDLLQRPTTMQYMDSKSGALALSLTQKIRRSKGDAPSIMNIVTDAEEADMEPCLLNELLDEAMNSFGPTAVKLHGEDYCELCMKRLRLLCELDPKEARLFARFLKTRSFCQKDARMYCAYAELELCAGNTAKAEKVLEDALASGSTPAELLRHMLSRLREASGTPEGHNSHAQNAPVASALGMEDASPPVRPKSLRYSGGFSMPIPEETHSEGTGQEGGLVRRDAPPMDWTRRSSLDNLSPIVEVDSVDQSHNESGLAFGDACHRRHSTGRRNSNGLMMPPAAVKHVTQVPRVPLSEAAHERLPNHASTFSTEEASDSSSNSFNSVLAEERPKLKQIIVNGLVYFKHETIGRGGSSKVYSVVDTSGRPFALKRVTTTSRSHFEALANEVTLLRQLRNCPNVIQVFDAQVSPERGLIQIYGEG